MPVSKSVKFIQIYVHSGRFLGQFLPHSYTIGLSNGLNHHPNTFPF